jgi:hypothetical protein
MDPVLGGFCGKCWRGKDFGLTGYLTAYYRIHLAGS